MQQEQKNKTSLSVTKDTLKMFRQTKAKIETDMLWADDYVMHTDRALKFLMSFYMDRRA